MKLPNWKWVLLILYVIASINNGFFLARINVLTCNSNSPLSYSIVGAIWPLQAVFRIGIYVFGYYPDHWEIQNLCNRSVGTVDGRG